MKPGHDSADAKQDLLDRAAIYFQNLVRDYKHEAPSGVIRWLHDYTDAETWELIEHHLALAHFEDEGPDKDWPEVPA